MILIFILWCYFVIDSFKFIDFDIDFRYIRIEIFYRDIFSELCGFVLVYKVILIIVFVRYSELMTEYFWIIIKKKRSLFIDL